MFARIRLIVFLASCVALGAAHSSGQDPSLSALYFPDTGNITMQAFNADGSPASLQIATFQFLSPLQYLDGVAASIPSAAASFATVLNTSTSTFFDPPRTGAEIYATNFLGSTPLFTGTWSLGNVARIGLSQSQIDSGFTTDGDVTPGGVPLPGRFLYQKQGDSAFYAGTISAVPEPSTYILGTAVAGFLVLMTRKRWLRETFQNAIAK